MDFMFEGICPSNKNVIDVDKNKIETTSNFVHEMLKSLCCVVETKRHLAKLEQTKWGGDGSFTNIFLGHGYLVVCSHKINFGKYSFAM